jgi:hypothetical protein
MSIETLLHEEIQDEFEELGKMEVGTEKYKTAVDGLTKLCDRAIELEKLKTEMELKQDQQNVDAELRAEQLKDERKDRVVKNSLTAAGIVIPTAVTIWGTLKSIKFEETGTITTIMGRGFIQKLLPKK